jgi:hypothetical protein
MSIQPAARRAQTPRKPLNKEVSIDKKLLINQDNLLIFFSDGDKYPTGSATKIYIARDDRNFLRT